jgi:hypothetical protein
MVKTKEKTMSWRITFVFTMATFMFQSLLQSFAAACSVLRAHEVVHCSVLWAHIAPRPPLLSLYVCISPDLLAKCCANVHVSWPSEPGLVCSSESPKQRMAINEVAAKLKSIKRDYSTSARAMQRAHSALLDQLATLSSNSGIYCTLHSISKV